MQMRVRLACLSTIILIVATVFAAPSFAASRAGNTTVSEQSLGQVHVLIDAHSNEFGGMAIDRVANSLEVYVTRGRATSTTTQQTVSRIMSLARADHAGGPRWTLRFVPVHRSQRQLDATMARITSQQPWASLSKNLLSVWYVDPPANKVYVGVTRVTSGLASAARSAFGDSVELARHERPVTQNLVQPVPAGKRLRFQRISQITKAASPAVTAPPRLLDSTPYWGGDRIVYHTSSSIIQCTAGFYWINGSTKAMSTAGHCSANGQAWLQGYYDSGTNTIYYTGSMGTVYTVQFGNNRIDGELMKGATYAADIYTTPNGGEAVGAPPTIAVGLSVCADGSFTNANCSGVVSAVNTCVDESDNGTVIHVCGVAIANSDNGTKLTQAGDSGGPVYSPGSNAKATGIISGGNSNGTEVVFSQVNNLESVFGGGPAHS